MIRCFSKIIIILAFASLAYGQRIGVIGDYGVDNSNVLQVSNLMKALNVDIVVTTGDNFHKTGVPLDNMVKKYFGDWFPSTGKPAKFFPVIGNHDLTDPTNYYLIPENYAVAFRDYFTWLPGNRRYYSMVFGFAKFVFMNSDFGGNYSYCPGKNKVWEPSGIDSNSIQGRWVEQELSNSNLMNVVVLHYPPFYNYPTKFSTATVNCNGSPYTFSLMNDTLTQRLRYDFDSLGANLVLSGHTHLYERHKKDSINYVISSLGGAPQGTWDTTGVMRNTTKYHFKGGFGATIIDVNKDSLYVRTFLVNGDTIDKFAVYPKRTVKLKLSIEGLLESNGDLRGDTVKVFLRSAYYPYAVIDTSVRYFSVDGVTHHTMDNPTNDTINYLEIRYRSGLPLWSKVVKLGNYVADVDLTNPNNVYNNSGKLVNGKVQMYSGDVTQDGAIDAIDYSYVDNGATYFEEGYLPTDVTNDFYVDGNDLNILDSNVRKFLFTERPW